MIEKDALEFLKNEIRRPSVSEICNTPKGVKMLVDWGAAQAPEIMEIERVVPRRHRFLTVEGLREFLASDVCAEDKGIIFVGGDRVFARLDYRENIGEHAVLKLEESAEFTALMKLSAGVGQKDLWRLLVTDLFDRVDLDLLQKISGLNVASKDEGSVKIDPTGVTQREGSASTRVAFPSPGGDGDNVTDINLEWEFTVRIWDCFDPEFTVKTRLEIDAEKGLVFTFHPQRLDEVMREAREALVTKIREDEVIADRFEVHEGEFAFGG